MANEDTIPTLLSLRLLIKIAKATYGKKNEGKRLTLRLEAQVQDHEEAYKTP
ncbi:unnamed protein product [Arabidopsis lyrata]|nr:unnamed protein product [Arabidopsis lyrata]